MLQALTPFSKKNNRRPRVQRSQNVLQRVVKHTIISISSYSVWNYMTCLPVTDAQRKPSAVPSTRCREQRLALTLRLFVASYADGICLNYLIVTSTGETKR